MNSTRPRSLTPARGLLAMLALATLVAACGEPPNLHAQTLKTTTVPPGTTFAMSRPVALELSAATGALAQRNGRVSVALTDGTILFQGPLGEQHPVQLKLAVPNKDKVLIATLTVSASAPVTARVPITNDSATHAFQ